LPNLQESFAMSSSISDAHPTVFTDDTEAPLGLVGLFGLTVFLVALAVVTANLLLLPVVPV
jgi:hypothetical protein